MTSTPNLRGLSVAAFESRRREEMALLIQKFGGRPHVSPSMREVDVQNLEPVLDFARRIQAGEFDMVIFMTGVGARRLFESLEAGEERQALLTALERLTTVARGPKPVAVMREFGIAPKHRVPEPNTWREVLTTLDREAPVAGLRVAIQEYGIPNNQLESALQSRGAQVSTLKVYDWDFPEDTGPLEANVQAIAAGERDVLLFTSSRQVINLLAVADRLGLADAVRNQWPRLVVGSIGPTTTETIRDQGLTVDFEPAHARMGHLVQSAAEVAGPTLDTKRRGAAPECRADNSTAPHIATSHMATCPAWHDSPFMKACRREPTPVTPIWLMRQAGRYLPEYREIREKTTFLELCQNPDLSAEVMIRSVARLGVDAAILFSDLLPILQPMGMDLEFAQGEGPVIHNPIRDASQVDRLRELESVAPLDYVMQAVRATRAGLPERLPLIGFGGAPFTLASYAIEGGGSRNYLATKGLMYCDEGAWHALAGRLARAVGKYLVAQVQAGAQAVQIFDSWAGCLGTEDYRRYVLPHTKAVIDQVAPHAPVINFATGNPALLPLLAEAGGSVIGVDWRIELDAAWRVIGADRAVQGNLDPAVLLSNREEIRRRAQRILTQAAGRPGHIFNLGHGVHPQTPPENAIALIDAVHELSAR